MTTKELRKQILRIQQSAAEDIRSSYDTLSVLTEIFSTTTSF